MSYFLRQSTTVTIKFGPFLDEDDGKTAETGLSIAQADIRLSKNGGDIAQTNNSAGATHDELGFYDVPLNTTDTNALGSLMVAVHKSGALPVFQYFIVTRPNMWDSWFDNDRQEVDIFTISGSPAQATSGRLWVYDDAGNTVANESKQDTIDGNVDAILLDTGTNGVVLADNAITAAKIDANAIGASELATDAIGSDQLAATAVTKIFAYVAEGALTFVQMFRVAYAVLAGKSAGGGTTTITFRDVADGKDRVSATVDSSGNRTAMTNDGT